MPKEFEKSKKTHRSPTRVSERIRKVSSISESPNEVKAQTPITHQDSTIQTAHNVAPTTLTKNNHTILKPQTIPPPLPSSSDTTYPILPHKTQTVLKPQTPPPPPPPDLPQTNKNTPHTVHKTLNNMNQVQIQQLISGIVPEFSGHNSENDLIRFIATADSIFNTLASDEERQIFNRLIRLRLTGEVYTRVSHRNIENYPALRDLLNNMYTKTYSLEELERGYINVTQSFGETIRNYGYRLLEALEKYKNGYRTKYGLGQIDAAYTEKKL